MNALIRGDVGATVVGSSDSGSALISGSRLIRPTRKCRWEAASEDFDAKQIKLYPGTTHRPTVGEPRAAMGDPG